jgi:hypothetical protein
MVLNTAASISFSQLNSTAYFTNGNLGINTTAPTANLDIVGTMKVSGLSALENSTATNVSTGTLNASTGITAASAQITNENVTTSTIATLRVSSNLLALGNSNTIGSIYTTGGNVGINTANPGSALHVAGPIAISPAGVGVHMGIDLNTYATIQLNSTIGSYIDFAAGGVDYSTRIISMSTGNLNIHNIPNTCNVGINNASPSANLDVVGTIKATGLSSLDSITTGSLSATNVIGNSISAGTLSGTTITGANLSLSGNLIVGGTLTTVNITSTNMLNTNISAGTINATGFTSLQNVTATNISTGGLNATNIYTGGLNATANITVTNAVGSNGSLLVSGTDAYGHALYVASSSAMGKRLAFNNNGTVGWMFSYDYGSNLPQNLILQGPGGNLGVGIDTPIYKLDVGGNCRINSSGYGSMLFSGIDDGGSNRLVFSHTSSTTQYHKIALQSTSLGAPNGGRANFHIQVNTSNDTSNASISDTKLFINGSNGNIGIRTTNPGYILDVAGTSRFGASGTTSTVLTSNRINSLGYMINANTVGNSVTTNVNVINKRIRASRATANSAVSTWTTRNLTANGFWPAICWSSELGLFVLGNNGISNSCQTSPDGINWTARTLGTNIQAWDVCWSPELSLFVMTNMQGTTNPFQTSPNGITWTTRTTGVAYAPTGICWSPELGIFVACSGVAGALVSSNGTSWTAHAISGSAVGNQRVCWSSELGIFVMTNNANGFFYSSNGTSWTSVSFTSLGTMQAICWSAELGIFVAGGYVASTGTFATSPDAINWTVRTSPITSIGHSNIIWSPELSLFLTSSSNYTFSSPDGVTWTTRSSGFNTSYSLCWSPDLSVFAITSNNGVNSIYISATGIPTGSNTIIAPKSQLSINASGNVGIGIPSPLYKLSVAGDIEITNRSTSLYIQPGLRANVTTTNVIQYAISFGGTHYFWDDVQSSGTITGVTKNFCIKHPLDDTKALVHAAIEAPQYDLIYSGKIPLISGQAIVNIDTDSCPKYPMDNGTFEALTRNYRIFLQNNESFDRVKASLSGNLLTIICENSTSTDTVEWMVIAERRDSDIINCKYSDNNGYLITQHNKENLIFDESNRPSRSENNN